MDEVPPILVVEDEPLIRLVLTEALNDGGYTVLEAENGPAALELIDGLEQLRGLVTDVRMGPGSNGWEVAQHAREKFAGLAVIYVTGDSMAEWTANGVPLSIALQKPFASAELVTALANLLVAQQTTPPPA
jgi:CheY-like chemotaxis protein|uniref:response regulator n=1 Tax=Altererythrobacter segetis TaxID=1104773 RepID=UPI001409C223|nr:response regulator [Altererythrobacter segetis]